jgi:dihydroorotate dehydrogenase electron transfer subunit
MKSFLTDVLSLKKINNGIYELLFFCPTEILKTFRPGQFAHIKIPQSDAMLLRRPFSIHGIDQTKNTVSIVYQEVGEGTRRFMEKKSRTLDVLMPLGNGFTMNNYKKILLVGGGIGIAPLHSVLQQSSACFDALLGYRGKEYVFDVDCFVERCRNVIITSDDGSIGQKGFTTDYLTDIGQYDAIFACGPRPMLQALQRKLDGRSIPAYASLEERMGCGMGGCAVCVCKIRSETDYTYKKVCTEGPVFDLKEVDF